MLEKLAKILWFALLWLMRRPRIKRLRHGWIRWVPESRRDQAWARFCRQERWARKNGVFVLQVILGSFLVVFFAQVVAAWVIMQDLNGSFDASAQFGR